MCITFASPAGEVRRGPGGTGWYIGSSPGRDGAARQVNAAVSSDLMTSLFIERSLEGVLDNTNSTEYQVFAQTLSRRCRMTMRPTMY